MDNCFSGTGDLVAQASTAPFPESVGHNPALAEGFKEVNEKLHEYGQVCSHLCTQAVVLKADNSGFDGSGVRAQYLTSCLPKFISQFSVYKDELTIYTSPEDLLHVLRFLKDHSQCLYKALMDVTAVDYPTRCAALALPLRLSHKATLRRWPLVCFC